MSTTELSLANAIAHDELGLFLQTIYIGCERCGNPRMLVINCEIQDPINEMEDIILQTQYFLKCMECGFEEADMITTIIPSWQWHPIRSKLPMNAESMYQEKMKISREWFFGKRDKE
jgi:hypothetical protein